MALTRLLRAIAVVFAGLVLLGIGGTTGAAQELYGSVVGTVQDTSGGHIPGATIQIVNRDTNLVLRAVSNATGAYTFTNVLPGTYDVKVTLQGFKEFTQQKVPVAT